MTNKTLALLEQVKAHTIAKNISARAISREIGTDHSNISKTLKGRYNTSLDTFTRICAAAGLEIRLTETKKK